jgi:hypothetical protein
MPSSSVVTYDASSTQLQNFGNTSLPKESTNIMEQSLPKDDEAALEKRLAQNNKISALCLEQHEKGLVPDYVAIKARVLQEDESLPVDRVCEQRYSSTPMHMSSPTATACYIPPVQLQNFGNQWPKEIKSATPSYSQLGDNTHRVVANSGTTHTELQPTRRQPRPENENLQRTIYATVMTTWKQVEETRRVGRQSQHVVADTGDFTMPVWEKLSNEQLEGEDTRVTYNSEVKMPRVTCNLEATHTELQPTRRQHTPSYSQRQGYEALKKKHEEDVQMFIHRVTSTRRRECTESLMTWKQAHRYSDNSSIPFRNNHVEPSALERQEEEALQASQDQVDSATTMKSANEAGSCNAGAGSNK